MSILTTIVVVGQAVLALFAGYIIISVFKSFQSEKEMTSLDQAKSFFKTNLSKVAIAFAILMWTCFLSELSVASYAVSLLFCALMCFAVWVRYAFTCKQIMALHVLPEDGLQAAQKKPVIVKKLQAGRIRGKDSENNPVYFSQDQLDRFVEVKGFVYMLSVTAAVGYVGVKSGLPIMGFYNDEGSAFLLYADDYVEIAA